MSWGDGSARREGWCGCQRRLRGCGGGTSGRDRVTHGDEGGGGGFGRNVAALVRSGWHSGWGSGVKGGWVWLGLIGIQGLGFGRWGLGVVSVACAREMSWLQGLGVMVLGARAMSWF